LRRLQTPTLFLTLCCLIAAGAAVAAATTIVRTAPSAAPSPAATVTQAPPGWSPDTQTLFAWVVQLAPPGPDRAARAIAIFDRQLSFQRKIAFHPRFDDDLQKVVDQLPPRQSTLIRAAALYSRDDIAWNQLPGGVHQISVSGQPSGAYYMYSLTHKYVAPEAPTHMAGAFTLKPNGKSPAGDITSVIGALGGELVMDTYGAGSMVDAGSAMLREVHGDLRAPWDTAPGEFNRHDRAALRRFRKQMPAFSARLEHYLEFHNVLDEFDGPGGPVVLFNLDAEVNADALKPFPHLYDFYRKLAPVLHFRSAIVDEHGNYWMRTRFESGHIYVTFMDRAGMLVPFDADYRPTGDGIVLESILSGRYRTHTSIKVKRLAMTFGLDDLDFATTYRRDADSVTFTNKMDAVPDLLAPPVIHGMMEYIAGQFLRVMAQGDGGFTAQLSSRRMPYGLYRYALGFRAEFNYSPTLEFLARIGDAIAEEHNEVVRREERKVGEELFDAFVTDYNSARPSILALDTSQEGSK
jgi:hypothetical protein